MEQGRFLGAYSRRAMIRSRVVPAFTRDYVAIVVGAVLI